MDPVVVSTSIAAISFLGGGFAISYKIGRHTGTLESSGKASTKAFEELGKAVKELAGECKNKFETMAASLSGLKADSGNLDKRMERIEKWIDKKVNGTQRCATSEGCPDKIETKDEGKKET